MEEKATGGLRKISPLDKSFIRKGTVITVILFLLIQMEFGTGSFIDRHAPFEYDWRVVRVFPHDPEAFTQGLIFLDGDLYESTGRRGKSGLRKVDLETGEILQQRELDSEYFAEGLAAWKENLILLTLDSGTGFVYDRQTFEKIRSFPVEGEGWGLTNDGDRLIMSDGTSTLRFLDPETFRETRRLNVTENGVPVSNLNELEMIEGKIFANVLFSNEIVIIDPGNGEVTGRLDLQALVTMVERETSVNVLNGIAYDAGTGRIFVTGKLWPNLFEIEIREGSDG